MKPLSKIFLSLSILTFSLNVNIFKVYSQYANTNGKLYVCMAGLGPLTTNFMKQNNIQNIPILYTRDMDPTNSLKLDVQNCTKAIIKSIPNASATGYAVIDWEGKIGSNLDVMPPSSPEYINAYNEFTKAYQLAKKLRPNMKWGFFAIPYPPLDKRDTRKNNTLYSLLQMEDVFYPALYVPYNTGDANGHRSQSEKKDWVSSFLLKSLTLASKMNKPVMVFIWHRYWSDGFKNNSVQLIPLNEFNEYLREMLALNYNGKMVGGLILWGADSYYYSIKSKPLMDELNANPSRDFNSYDDSLTYKYLKGIYGTVNASN